jgi:hypothetical protein
LGPLGWYPEDFCAGGGEKAEEIEGVPVLLGGGEVVEKRLENPAWFAPDCGVGWANCVVDEVVEKEL